MFLVCDWSFFDLIQIKQQQKKKKQLRFFFKFALPNVYQCSVGILKLKNEKALAERILFLSCG